MPYTRSLEYNKEVKEYMWESEINGVSVEIWGDYQTPNPLQINLVDRVVSNSEGICGQIRQILSHSFNCSNLIQIEEIFLDSKTETEKIMVRFRIIGSNEDKLDYPFVEFSAETNGDAVFQIRIDKV